MGRVWYLEVEGQVFVVLIIPAGQDDENGGLLPIALINTEEMEKRK